MRINYFSVLIISCLINLFASAENVITFKQPGTLSVCSYSEFKPIIYGNGEGYEAELLKKVAKTLHVNIKFYPEKIYDGLWRLPSKSYTLCDVSAGGFTASEERKKEGNYFSVPSVHFSQSLLVRKKDYKSGKIVGYASFKNSKMKIGVVPGTTGQSYAVLRAKKNGLSRQNIVQLASETELLPALLNKKIDAIARGKIGNEYQASLDKNLITIDKKNFGEDFTYSIDPKNKSLQEAVNRIINECAKKMC